METSTFEQRIEKLRNSKTIISSGLEYVGLYELNNRSAEKFIRANLRGNYVNNDTGDIIRITRKGAEKVTRHDAESIAHLKSLAIIPELIRSSIFIGEVVNEKEINDYDSFRYYVVGLQMEGVDYTVKLVIGVKNGTTYYDHALTPIVKEKRVSGFSRLAGRLIKNKVVPLQHGSYNASSSHPSGCAYRQLRCCQF